MTITLDGLRTDIRAKFQNLSPAILSEETLDLDIKLAIARLSHDRPNEANYSLSATGEKHSLTALISNWLPGFSTVRQVWIPIPTTSMDNVEPVESESYRVVPIGAVDYLFVSGGIGSGGALIVYTVPWTLTGINGAVATTLTDVLYPALLWISCSHVALSQAAKMAGQREKQHPADFVNFGTSNADQYRRQAREFEKSYLSEIGLDRDRPKAVSVTRSYRGVRQDGEPYMTHRSTMFR